MFDRCHRYFLFQILKSKEYPLLFQIYKLTNIFPTFYLFIQK